MSQWENDISIKFNSKNIDIQSSAHDTHPETSTPGTLKPKDIKAK